MIDIEPDEDRPTYRELRAMAMESAYRSSKSDLSGVAKGYFSAGQSIDIFGHFFDQTYECFSDIEEIFWRTLELILYHGRDLPIVHSECTRIINDILSRQSFDDLAKQMSEDEAEELREDLKLLKFID